jgi:hypothetical protein
LVKAQVPVRTDNSDILEPGSVEMNSVAHCVGSLLRDLTWSINLTDIVTQWTQTHAIWNKDQHSVVKAVTMNVNQAAPLVLGGHNSTIANVDRWFDGVMSKVLFHSGFSNRSEFYYRSLMGARHFIGLSIIGNKLALTVTGSNQPPSIAAVPHRYIPCQCFVLVGDGAFVRCGDGGAKSHAHGSLFESDSHSEQQHHLHLPTSTRRFVQLKVVGP